MQKCDIDDLLRWTSAHGKVNMRHLFGENVICSPGGIRGVQRDDTYNLIYICINILAYMACVICRNAMRDGRRLEN